MPFFAAYLFSTSIIPLVLVCRVLFTSAEIQFPPVMALSTSAYYSGFATDLSITVILGFFFSDPNPDPSVACSLNPLSFSANAVVASEPSGYQSQGGTPPDDDWHGLL